MKTYIKERPIPFSADMVRALLQGWKTQTSRTRGLERFNGWPDWKIPLGEDAWELCHFTEEEPGIWRAVFQDPRGECPPGLDPIVKCPYGKPGERLWVREPWKVGLFLPRCASRILLEITDIEVRKLKSITAEEARAEGIEAIFTMKKRPLPAGKTIWNRKACASAPEILFSRCGIVCTAPGKRKRIPGCG